MSEQADHRAAEVAVCGQGILPGMIYRAGDPLKHLGPTPGLDIPFWSPLFSTRCGLEADAGPWQHADGFMNDDAWCPPCLRQAGIPHRVELLGGQEGTP
jgi:hypothetical protein